MSKFSHCFPGDDGNVVCQHHNGSWIVFPGTRAKENEKTSEPIMDEEEDSEDDD